MESLPEPIKTFLAALKERDPSLRPQIEAGGEKVGNWWIDLPAQKWIVIEWRPDSGFGLSDRGASGYGEGPKEIFRSPGRAAHRVTQWVAGEAELSPTGLRAMRELYGLTQNELAGRLKKGQAALSRQEGRRDFKIETIKEVVEALGGTVEVRAIFPDSNFPIYQTAKSKGRLPCRKPSR